ncbi:MAG: hypothetical protein ACI8YO_000527 [Gammaproteobacteria bacterium]|jgi:hypothetical protein
MSMAHNEQLTQLFDLIKTKKNLSEDDILSKILPNQKRGNIAVIKNRLYNHILKTLNQFHSEKSIEKQVKDKIQNIELLYEKGLFDQCSKIIKSAKKIALSNDLHHTFLQISKWEKKIAVQFNYENVDLKVIDEICDADTASLEKIKSYHVIWDVKSKVLLKLYGKGKARSEEDILHYIDIIKKLPSKKQMSLDLEGEYLHNHTMSAYYFCVLDPKKSYALMKKNHELVRSNKEYFSSEPNIMLSILTNAIYLSRKLKKDKETDKYLVELELLYAKQYDGKELQMRIFADRCLVNLASHIMRTEYDDGLKFIPEIEQGLSQFEDEINSTKLAGIYYSLGLIYFGVGDHSKALFWINKILNEVRINEAEDQYCYAKILHMIIHVELSNDDYIIHALKSLKRYLSTRKRLDEFENAFIDLISKVVKTRKEAYRKVLYEGYADEMKSLKTNPFSQSAFEYFDFEAWARNKSQEEAYPKYRNGS